MRDRDRPYPWPPSLIRRPELRGGSDRLSPFQNLPCFRRPARRSNPPKRGPGLDRHLNRPLSMELRTRNAQSSTIEIEGRANIVIQNLKAEATRLQMRRSFRQPARTSSARAPPRHRFLTQLQPLSRHRRLRARRRPPRRPSQSHPRPVLQRRARPKPDSRVRNRSAQSAPPADRTSSRTAQGVQPGSRAALQCLERNTAEVSKRCQDALAGLGGSATGAEDASRSPSSNTAASTTPESFPLRRLGTRQELPILRSCAADVRSMCRGIPPGGGRIIACLARNGSQLSAQCRDALAELRD